MGLCTQFITRLPSGRRVTLVWLTVGDGTRYMPGGFAVAIPGVPVNVVAVDCDCGDGACDTSAAETVADRPRQSNANLIFIRNPL